MGVTYAGPRVRGDWCISNPLSHSADPRWSREGWGPRKQQRGGSRLERGAETVVGLILQVTDSPQEVSKRDHLMAASNSPPGEDELSLSPGELKGPGGHSS